MIKLNFFTFILMALSMNSYAEISFEIFKENFPEHTREDYEKLKTARMIIFKDTHDSKLSKGARELIISSYGQDKDIYLQEQMMDTEEFKENNKENLIHDSLSHNPQILQKKYYHFQGSHPDIYYAGWEDEEVRKECDKATAELSWVKDKLSYYYEMTLLMKDLFFETKDQEHKEKFLFFKNLSFKNASRAKKTSEFINKKCFIERDEVFIKSLYLHYDDKELRDKNSKIFAYAGANHVNALLKTKELSSDILVLTPKNDDSGPDNHYFDKVLHNKPICLASKEGLGKAIENIYQISKKLAPAIENDDISDILKKLVAVQMNIINENNKEIENLLKSSSFQKERKKELIQIHSSLIINRDLIVKEIAKIYQSYGEDKQKKKAFLKNFEKEMGHLYQDYEAGKIDIINYYTIYKFLNSQAFSFLKE